MHQDRYGRKKMCKIRVTRIKGLRSMSRRGLCFIDWPYVLDVVHVSCCFEELCACRRLLHLFLVAFLLGSCGPGNLPEKCESSRKWLGEGAKCLWTPRARASCTGVNGVAPVQKRVWVVQKTLGRPLLPEESKRPFAPSPNHFWRLFLFGESPRSTASQC